MTDAEKCAAVLKGGAVVHLLRILDRRCYMCGIDVSSIAKDFDNRSAVISRGSIWKNIRSSGYLGVHVVCTDADLPDGWFGL
jgi:hypothetical protein